jgi:hypothetical protein
MDRRGSTRFPGREGGLQPCYTGQKISVVLTTGLWQWGIIAVLRCLKAAVMLIL